jgi:uncharacterized membrane protein
MDTTPRSDSIWFVIAIVAAALGGVIAIAAIAAPADAAEPPSLAAIKRS